MLWSNDFAIPTAGLFAILFISSLWMGNEFCFKNIAIYLLLACLTWAGLIGLTTIGHPLPFIKYNILDVAKDQWWYFGPYSETTRIFEPQQIFRLLSKEKYFPLLVLTLAIVVAMHTKLIEHVLVVWIGLCLFAGGALSSIGGHLGGYFGGFYFWGLMVIVFTIFKLLCFGMDRALKSNNKVIFLIKSVFLASVFLVSVAVSIFAWRQYYYINTEAKIYPNKFYVSELGSYLGVEWKSYIELARNKDARHVVEEYWGIWSATRKISSDWPVDSVIHALGSTREVAGKILNDADFIITTRYATSPMWQPWNVSQNFWFYDELFKKLVPFVLSPLTIVWRKTKEDRLQEIIECHPAISGRYITVDATENGFYRVEINYRFSGSGRHLLQIRNNLSFGADAGGYVSVDPDPDANKVIFPAYFWKGQNDLDIRAVGPGKYDLEINSCTSSRVAFVDEDVLATPSKVGD